MRACHNFKFMGSKRKPMMGHKRKPTAHQKQIRFLAVLFAIIMVAFLVGMMLLFNRPVGGYH